mmetsp:Transcript_43245/g.105833  ORF Transcript_43245/g.105833 Transcript_43245/m.105833 type:complete len:204 (-) Transcript_43245:179-790(-)
MRPSGVAGSAPGTGTAVLRAPVPFSRQRHTIRRAGQGGRPSTSTWRGRSGTCGTRRWGRPRARSRASHASRSGARHAKRISGTCSTTAPTRRGRIATLSTQRPSRATRAPSPPSSVPPPRPGAQALTCPQREAALAPRSGVPARKFCAGLRRCRPRRSQVSRRSSPQAPAYSPEPLSQPRRAPTPAPSPGPAPRACAPQGWAG